jgi:hypothetical protein
MKKKSAILVTEQQFKEIILKSIIDNPEKFVKSFFGDLFGNSDQDKEDDGTSKEAGYSTAGDFQELDLNNPDDFPQKWKNKFE